MDWPFIDVASLNYTATLRTGSHVMLGTDGKTGGQKVKYLPKGRERAKIRTQVSLFPQSVPLYTCRPGPESVCVAQNCTCI